jgi:hypothetical protein
MAGDDQTRRIEALLQRIRQIRVRDDGTWDYPGKVESETPDGSPIGAMAGDDQTRRIEALLQRIRQIRVRDDGTWDHPDEVESVGETD